LFHPTQKPVESLKAIIEAYSKPGDVVLDPFAGSGSTAVAAQELERFYIGIEKDPNYAQIAQTRLKQFSKAA
jgi:adenine-specific DNA-methyltransferase